MTRNGKIARLPGHIRDELNQRLDNSEEGETLLTWLNGRPAVQESLKAHFDGAPVSKQNLSEWRLGGFREWQVRRELEEEKKKIVAPIWAKLESDQLAGIFGGGERGRKMAQVITVLKHDLPPPRERKEEEARETNSAASKSHQVKASQTKSNPEAPGQAQANSVKPVSAASNLMDQAWERHKKGHSTPSAPAD